MPMATFAVPNFLGGEISTFAQGRFDRPDYRVSLNVCLNAFPVEIGPWTRRPGTAYAGHSRGGAKGRVIKFDFEQADPITLEFTDGKVRFRNGTTLISTNDTQGVVSVSSANPAVVQVQNAVTWATGDTVLFPGASTPLLENRQFVMTSIDSTHFSLADPITGAGIDGSTLGALATGTTVEHAHELTTVYIGGSWSTLRAVQAETTDVLLCATIPPQILSVATEPSSGILPQFAITPAVFNDGPYLDPFTNGVQVTPSAQVGSVTLTLTFAQYSSTTAYAKGAFVTSSSVNYESLVDQNIGNTPVSSPSAWQAVSAAVAINNGRGFLGTDVGRLVRLLSEPAPWVATTGYTQNAVVSYNPSGVPGASTYWSSLPSTTNTGNVPGTDLVHWQLVTQDAVSLWTWGRITGLSNIIDRQLAGSSSIGNMTLFNGINAPFDGNFSKSISSSAGEQVTGGSVPAGDIIVFSGYVGKNYGASPQVIQQATIYPPTDRGFGFGQYIAGGITQNFLNNFTLNLRASNAAPTFASNGTLLGSAAFTANNNTITILSTDQVNSYRYVWIELINTVEVGGALSTSSYSLDIGIAQISFFSPTTTSNAGCTIEVLGPALLYANTVFTWRLGAYSNTTGWPPCGCYDGSRLWLGGAISNRLDASVSNGISGATINFAPTDQYGVVADSNAITETINADSVNPLFWMIPDLQGVLIGTQAGEWLILAPTSGPITPTNIDSRRTTTIGSENVEPRRTEHTITFVKRFGRKLMEYFADVFSGKFSAPNLADKAQHITRQKIAELAYTDSTTPIMWGRDQAGGLFGMTYKRDALTTSSGPTYAAWHRHALGSGRTVESICAGPSTDGELDSLTMMTSDGTTRHVEVLTDAPDEDTDLTSAWFLDDAVNPTSTSTTVTPSTGAPFGGMTINGLWHLNGKTVQVWAGGLDCGDRGDLNVITDFTVTNGSCFVPFGDGVSAGPGQGLFTQAFATALSLSQIIVGFTYDSDGQLVRRIEPAESGSRTGPALGLIRRDHRYAMLLANTKGLSVGTTFDALEPANFREADDITPIGTLDSYSGIFQDTLTSDYNFDGMICWRVARPYPATVVAISGNNETQDQ